MKQIKSVPERFAPSHYIGGLGEGDSISSYTRRYETPSITTDLDIAARGAESDFLNTVSQHGSCVGSYKWGGARAGGVWLRSVAPDLSADNRFPVLF